MMHNMEIRCSSDMITEVEQKQFHAEDQLQNQNIKLHSH